MLFKARNIVKYAISRYGYTRGDGNASAGRGKYKSGFS